MSRSKSPRVFSRALGRELKLSRKDVYAWRDHFLAGGPQALRGRGRPPRAASGAAAPATLQAPPDGPGEALAAARRHVAELERKIGQQQVELDLFRQALRQVNDQR